MRLIDADAFSKEMKVRQIAAEVAIENSNGKTHYTDKEHWEAVFCTFAEAKLALDDTPTVEAVPLDKLCEWLAEQDYEIYCFMCQERFDTGGGCPNQVYEKKWLCGSKGHWKAFLKKVMEGCGNDGKG